MYTECVTKGTMNMISVTLYLLILKYMEISFLISSKGSFICTISWIYYLAPLYYLCYTPYIFFIDGKERKKCFI